eukprot:4788254-Prorocentrum_lima.AAC.1
MPLVQLASRKAPAVGGSTLHHINTDAGIPMPTSASDTGRVEPISTACEVSHMPETLMIISKGVNQFQADMCLVDARRKGIFQPQNS